MDIFWPVPNVFHTQGVAVSQWFGQDFWDKRIDDWHYRTLYGYDGHNGIDVTAPRGTMAFCPHTAYLVECTAKDTGFGLRVTLAWEENNFIWMLVLGHFLSVNFNNKSFTSLLDNSIRVPALMPIAKIDSTGDSTGDHTHIGLYQHDLQGNRLNFNNGFGGAINPARYMRDWKMSNAKLGKIEGEKGFGWFLEDINEDAIKSNALHFGYVLPEKADGKLDWDNIRPDVSVKRLT